MTQKEEFEFFTENLFDNAAKSFKKTEQYKLLRKKLDQMDRDCDKMLTPDQKQFAEECFDLLSDINSQQEYYVYCKALTDSVSILKWLGILA